MINGRNDRVRTCDIVLPKHARYQLRYIPVKIKKGLMSQSLGAPAENRTPDTLIKSQVLYQLSYRGKRQFFRAKI